MYADELNAAGLDQRALLPVEFDIPWTGEAFKEQVIKFLIKKAFNKDSTTELDTKEIDMLVDIVTRNFGEKHSIFVEFPSKEEV